MKLIKIVLPLFLFSLIWTSCGDDPKSSSDSEDPIIDSVRNEFQPENLVGKWILTYATIDRVPTHRLDSAYFEFTEEKVLKTNVMGSAEEGTYSLDGKTLTQKTAKTIEYKIEKLIKDTLVMNMEFSDKKFQVLLEK